MERVRRDQIGDVADMTVFELIFSGLDSERVAVDGDHSAEPEILVGELLRRVEEVLPLLGEDLYPRSDLIVAFEVGDGGQVVERGRPDAVEDVDLDQFVLEFDVDGMDALGVDTLDHSHLRGFLVAVPVALLALLALLLVLAQLRRSDGQPEVVLLGGGDVDLDALADAALVDLGDIVQLQLTVRQDALDVVAELNHNTVGVDVADKTTVLLSLIDVLVIQEQVLGLHDLWIIANLDDLVP